MNPTSRLPRSVLLAYGAPWGAYMLASLPLNLWLMKHATDVLLIAPAAMGAVLLLARLWDAVSDPLAGHLSDRTRSRFGRRRVWILGSAPLLMLTLVTVWAPPSALHGLALVLWIAVALVLWETASTGFYVPYQALGLELAGEYHERTRVFAWRHVVSMLGYAGGMGAVYLIRTGDPPRDAALWVALASGAVLSAVLVFCALRLPERASHQGRGGVRITSAFRDVMRNPHARLLFAVYGVETFGMGVISTFAPYVMEDVVGRPDLLEMLLLCWMIPQFVLAPLWIRVSRRVGKKRLWLFGLVCTTVGFSGQVFLTLGNWPLVFGLVLILGVGTGIANVISPSVQADVVDYDELETGERKEGAYTAVWNFVRKGGMALAGGVGGLVLGASGYDGAAELQTEPVRDTIRLFASLVPASLYAFSILLFVRFSLDETEHARVMAGIRERQSGG